MIVKSKRKKETRGRKPWSPTPEQRQDVMLCRAAGMKQLDIAIAIGVDEETLVKHCYEELNSLYLTKKLKQLQNLEKSANKGNVSAQKAMLMILGKEDISFREPGRQRREKFVEAKIEKPVKQVKLGKKEEALVEARKLPKGTTWENHLTKQ